MPFLRMSFAAATVIALTAAASAKPVTLAAETNMRAAPGTKSEVVTLIPKGSAIEVGECDAGWCKVKFGDREGFAIARNLGEAPPVTTGSTASPERPQNQADLQRLRRGYEDYFDGDGRNDRAADLPAQQRRAAQSRPRTQTQDDYYDDDDDGPVVAYGRPAYVPGPPVYYSYAYPYPRPYYYAPRYYYRRW